VGRGSPCSVGMIDHQLKRMGSLSMSQHLSARLVPLVSVVAMLAGIAGAQVPTGSINGIVTDPKDAIVIGATSRCREHNSGRIAQHCHEWQWSL
jgi:hypothetical protein